MKTRNLILSCLYICTFAFNVLPASALQVTPGPSGTCGENAFWQFSNGTLTIRGEGEVICSDSAWDDFKDQISAVVVEDGITALGCQADSDSALSYDIGGCFRNCSVLQSVSLPASLQYIGYGVFAHCTALETIDLPVNVEVLGNECFFSCTSLTDVSMPATLKALGDNCFSACMALDNLVLPEALTALPGACFGSCTNLQNLMLPESITQLGDFCFTDCSALKEITLPKGISNLPALCFYQCTALEAVHTQADTIGDRCFAECTALTDLPPIQSFKSIGQGAFRHTPYLEAQGDLVVIKDQLYHVSKAACTAKIPDGVTSIQADACEDARNLVAVELPDTMTALDVSVFKPCSYLLDLTIPASIQTISGKPQSSLQRINGVPGSAAEEFAEKYHIAFSDLNETACGPDMRIDFTKDVWHFSNTAEAFGDEYYLTEHDRSLVQQNILTNGLYEQQYDGQKWGGSCFGMSFSVLLAKNGLLPMTELSQLKPTPEIISLINYYQAIYYSADFTKVSSSVGTGTSPQKFYRMLQMLKQVPYGESPLLLQYSTSSGGHAVIAYGVEQGEWEYQKKQYHSRVLIWDPNKPTALTDSVCMYFDDVTFEWYIPLYNLSNLGYTGIGCCTNSFEAMNVYPYPFEVEFAPGDVNCDGAVTVADALLLQKSLLGLTKLSTYANADMNGDEKVDARDLTMLKRALMTA